VYGANAVGPGSKEEFPRRLAERNLVHRYLGPRSREEHEHAVARGGVLAEVDYFLRGERDAMRALMDDLARGAFTYAPPTQGSLARAMEIDRRYASPGLGLVDASIVALAEETGVVRLATRDVRHFEAVRLHGGRRFELVVRPRRTER
jgi:predicted nucleic acid-binding protein